MPPAAESASVFFSYNSHDRLLLEPLAVRLIEEHDVWLDKWDLRAGREYTSEIDNALRTCSAGAVFLGAHGWGTHHLREARFIMERAEADADFTAIPVLLPGATEESIDEAGDFFRSRHRVDFRDGMGTEEAFQILRAAIIGASQGPPAMSASKVRRDAQRWSGTVSVPADLLHRLCMNRAESQPCPARSNR